MCVTERDRGGKKRRTEGEKMQICDCEGIGKVAVAEWGGGVRSMQIDNGRVSLLMCDFAGVRAPWKRSIAGVFFPVAL